MKSTGNTSDVVVARTGSTWDASPVMGPQQAVTPPRVDNAEQLLQASRRLDWRFLLPDPALERVAYCGPEKGSLLTSLRLFATELHVFQTATDADPKVQYDVVVACTPTANQLHQAVHLVRPGGSLYVETPGLLWPAQWRRRRNPLLLRQRPRLWHPNDYVRALNQWGLAEASAFWFWPNFDHCTKIIPLADPVVLPYVFAPQTQPRGAKARLKAAYKQWIVRSGWLTFLQPSFGIIAQ
ncbi:MAG: hypothetical protein R3E79_29505 [Caldilineaceae bacterium]